MAAFSVSMCACFASAACDAISADTCSWDSSEACFFCRMVDEAPSSASVSAVQTIGLLHLAPPCFILADWQGCRRPPK